MEFFLWVHLVLSGISCANRMPEDRNHVLCKCTLTDNTCVLYRCRHTYNTCVLHRCRHWTGLVHYTDVGIRVAILYVVDCVYFSITATLGVLVRVGSWALDTASPAIAPPIEAFCEVRSLTFHRCLNIICHSW
jgi:hypothetical protein